MPNDFFYAQDNGHTKFWKGKDFIWLLMLKRMKKCVYWVFI